MPLETLQIRLAPAQITFMDRLVKHGVVRDRSSAIRIAVYLMMENVDSKSDILRDVEQARR